MINALDKAYEKDWSMDLDKILDVITSGDEETIYAV